MATIRTTVSQRISTILESLDSDTPKMPPAQGLYNEGWMLRLTLDWFSRHEVPGHPLTFPPRAEWFSEAMLPSRFLTRPGGDPLAEKHTHADGAIGHFAIGKTGRTDLCLDPDAEHLVIAEAKMFSRLKEDVTNAPFYDQAARNVGCIAELLSRAKRHPNELRQLGFYVLAPETQIERGVFGDKVSSESILAKMTRRVEAYQGVHDDWFREWFTPLLSVLKLGLLSWESILVRIKEVDASYARELGEFYGRCREFGRRSDED